MRNHLFLGIAVTLAAAVGPATAERPAPVPPPGPRPAPPPTPGLVPLPAPLPPVEPAPGAAPGAAAALPGAAITDDGLGRSGTIFGFDAANLVTFTFDDGPHEPTTTKVLAALAAHDVPATFFVVGKRLAGKSGERRRQLLVEIDRAGHAIGNHSWSHPALTALSEKAREREVDATQQIVEEILGRPPTTLRPPFGATSPKLTALLARRGLTEVIWSIDTKDYLTPDAARLRKAVVARIAARGGGIVLFHDTKKATATALPGILADLEALNCARLGRGEEPILPVSLHYFVRDGAAPRPVPPEVAARTARYRAALVERCTQRGPAPGEDGR